MNFQDISEVDFLLDPNQSNGISLDFVSHDLMYKELLDSGTPPILVNDYVEEFSESKAAEAINSLIRIHFGTDELDVVPRCDKGCTSGGYNKGIICPICGTVVERIIDKPLVSQIWIKPPQGIPAFINPHFWNLFESIFKTTKFNLIEYLTSRSYIPGGRGENKAASIKVIPKLIAALDRAGIKRGMDYFYNNFDYVMDVVLTKQFMLKSSKVDKECPERSVTKDDICNKLRLIVKHYRNCIFSHYLPFPSKLIMVSEEGSGIGYIDKNIPLAFDALKTIMQLERPKIPVSERTVETKTVRANKTFAEYYANFRKNTYGRKNGIARKQQGSTRSPMSGRAVIAPRALIHNYDEIIAPWAWSISICRVHIANKLMRMFYTPQEIFLFVDKCIINCEGEDGDIMEGIFHTLMDESPSKGIDVSNLRNPTLTRLSNQYFKIVKIIRDTNINAVMISVLAIKGSNAD